MKYAILSTDNNPDYYSLIPITCHSWRKLGYTPVVLCVGGIIEGLIKYCPETIFVSVPHVEGVKDSTVAQVARLFIWQMHPFNEDDTLIIGDADMLVTKDIFQHQGEIVSYGHDLTGRSEIPMCYVKATVAKWRELMKSKGILDLDIPDRGRSDKWEDYWSTDQQLLTTRAQEYGMHRITFVDRGHGSHGLPTGRWDRYKWDSVPDDIIDVHMLRSPLANWDKIEAMVKRLWPEDNWEWINEYYEELKQLQ